MRYITVTNRTFKAIVDDEDFDKLSMFKWRADVDGYIIVCGTNSNVRMHHLVLGAKPPPNLECDHRNGIRHDNRKDNLRYITHASNMRNRKRGSSQFVGVKLDKRRGRWQAGIYVKGKFHYIGMFESEELAARAYDIKALDLLGDEATLNFPWGGVNSPAHTDHVAPSVDFTIFDKARESTTSKSYGNRG